MSEWRVECRRGLDGPLWGTLYKAFTSLSLPAKGYELPKGKSVDQIRTNYFFTFLLWKTALLYDLCWPSADQVNIFVEPTQVKLLRCQAILLYFCKVNNLFFSENSCNIVENTLHVNTNVDAWNVAQTSRWSAPIVVIMGENVWCQLMVHSHLKVSLRQHRALGLLFLRSGDVVAAVIRTVIQFKRQHCNFMSFTSLTLHRRWYMLQVSEVLVERSSKIVITKRNVL